jgi:glycosyltransferase involved in cell wall biosynthesis
MMALPDPLVSVIVPAFNAADFLGRAIASALGQAWRPIEIVIVDDGSTDATADLAESFGPLVRVFRQANGGPAAARNRAIAESRGAFLAFLDADDAWSPNHIDRCLAPMLMDGSVGMCYSHAIRRDTDGRELPIGVDFEGRRIFPRHFWRPATQVTPSTVCRRSVALEAGLFDARRIAYEDVDLWIRISEISRIVEIPEPQVVVHARGDSLSKSADEEAVRDCYFRIIGDGLARRPDLYAPHRATIEAEAWWFWGKRYYFHGNYREARRCFAASLRRRPTAAVAVLYLKTWVPARAIGWIHRLRA